MIRDPFYRQIIARLADNVDPEIFEQCVADLLRIYYPTLVPIRGGSDSGMDGAVGNLEGEPFPLITTIRKDVIGNFTKNINSYLKEGKTQRRVILATSQSLTARKQNNLYKRARELGFILLNIYSSEAIANLLYRSPQWSLELLGLTGNPSPLSIVPKTKRLQLENPLIGREKVLTWLESNPGDKLIVGQPGIGKTFLLYKFALNNEGLFVISSNRGEIASSIRSEEPSFLIVDDAHSQLDLLLDLKQIREEIEANFSILASSWPGGTQAVANSLNLTRNHIYELELLTRDEVVKVVNSTGIKGPNRLIREIVDQAEGRPGLAVTLTNIYLRGEVKEVVLGNILTGQLLDFFKQTVGAQVSVILAGFAVGGDTGIPTNVVSDAFNYNIVEFKDIVDNLAAGGVIFERGENLSVRPPALRYALVRDIFYQGATSLPINNLIKQAPSLSDAVITLIRAKARGAKISRDYLRELLKKAWSETVWEEYAWLGKDESTWIMQNYPEKLISIAQPVLHYIPELVIPLLMGKAIDDKRPLHPHPNHPLRLIKDWIIEGYPGSSEALHRRETLFKVVINWLSEGNDVEIGFRAIEFVLSPVFESSSMDPGSGNKLTISRGFILDFEKTELMKKWPKVVELLRNYDLKDWEPIHNIVRKWAFPSRFNMEIPEQTYNMMREFAGQMLSDIAVIGKHRLGVLRWVKELSEALKIPIEVSIDKDFKTLFPRDEIRKKYEATQKMQLQAVQNLAVKWNKLKPEQVIDRVSQLEQEAQLAQINWPRWTPVLFQELAQISPCAPTVWISLIKEKDFLGDCMLPFLHQAVKKESPGWLDLALFCLEKPKLKWVIISLVLTTPDIPETLIESTLKEMKGHGGLIETHIIRNEINPALINRLLLHEDPEIVSATAKGLWHSGKGEIDEAFLENWERAVINCVKSDYELSSIFSVNHDLANKWLIRKIENNSIDTFRLEKTIKVIGSVLSREDKRELLKILSDNYDFFEVVGDLVNNDLELFQDLLSFPHLKKFHLLPLSGMSDELWSEMAKYALSAGYKHEEIISATYGFSYSWSGNESDMWDDWIKKFEPLCASEDEDIRKLGEIGRRKATLSKENALEQERNESIFGRW